MQNDMYVTGFLAVVVLAFEVSKAGTGAIAKSAILVRRLLCPSMPKSYHPNVLVLCTAR